VVPLGLVAAAGWLVKQEEGAFLRKAKPSKDLLYSKADRYPIYPRQLDLPEVTLEHARFGDPSSPDDHHTHRGSPLGNNTAPRALGARPSAIPDWLAQQPAKGGAAPTATSLAAIPDFIPVAPPAEPHFETVPEGAGFHITADEATKMDIKAETVVFNGQVTMTSPQFHLTSSKLTIYLSSDKKSFRLAEAKGDVKVQLTGVPDEKKYRGQSGMAVYDPKKGTLIMTDWPKIQGQGQELIAAEASTKVTLIPATGKMFTEGRAQTRIARQLMAAEAGRP
jgi:lipopolysaccharide transport protein LptA